MKSRTLRSLLLPLMAIASLALVSGCARKASGPSDTLVWARGGDSVRLDPAHETDGESFKACDNIYDNLVQYADTTTEVVPGLAYRWEHSPDNLTWTFHLRTGVMFHDSTVFNADAVVFSLKRQDPQWKHPHNMVGGPYTYWQGMDMGNIIKDVVAANDSTAVITLKRPNAPFLANLAMNFCSIVSPTSAQKYGEDFFKHPVGTGPFKFVEWVKDDHITLERNESYWGGTPPLKRVILRVIPDKTVRLLELRKGTIQGMDGVTPDQVDPIRKDKSLVLQSQPGMNVFYLAMNMDKKPFDNLWVRQALNYAINKKAIVEALYRNLAVAAVNPMPPVLWGYNKEIPGYDYNPQQAREMLKRGGFPDGFKMKLHYMSNPRPYVPEPQKVAQAVQADLKAVGIDAELVTMEWGTYLDETQHGRHQACLMGWNGDNGDPDNFLFTLLDVKGTQIPAQNIAFYRSPEFSKLVTAAQVEPEQSKRAVLYQQAQKRAFEDAPWVPLVHTTQLQATKASVHDLHIHPTAKLRFAGVSVR